MSCSRKLKFSDCKDPDSNVPYSFNWSEWTAAESTTLVDDVNNREILFSVTDDFVASEDTSPLVLGSVVVDVANSIIYFWITGGTEGLNYNVTCRITAANGIVEDQTAVLKCREK